MIYSTQYKSPIGNLLLASDGKNLIGLWIEKQKYFAGNITEKMIKNETLPIFIKTKKWLDGYFDNKNPKISNLALKPQGTEFRKIVWNLLCEIPYGQTTTYGEIAKHVAKRLGKEKMSSRAVGSAIGHNPISIIIPCHRVIGANGKITGYAGGVKKKIKLLKHENKN